MATGTTHGSHPSPEPVRGPLGELAVAELRHPTETSRFVLALVAMAVAVVVALAFAVAVGRAAGALATVVAVALAVLVFALFLPLLRIRLLGDAVLVSRETLPEVQDVVDVVRTRLAYVQRVDVFVVDKISRVLAKGAGPVALTTFFGVHVLLVEGEAVGDLSDRKEREQLLFTFATYLGALKARYAQWWAPLFTAFEATGLTRFVRPFVLPYLRATVYSGDRIAYVCCGDLDISLQAVHRFLVGNQVAPHIRGEGLVGQALGARQQRVLRAAQLLRATPHATNRYLELLTFVRQRTPEAFDAWVRAW
jgi:hypothetical protein